MCGINGIMTTTECSDMQLRIKRMNEALIHRGPDAGGIFVESGNMFALGHRRLSVIDIDERSIQPMTSNSGRWILVYNGEIYNYRELKEKTDYTFKTESDTEVILAYLDYFGLDEFLKQCNGMFSFAAYDCQERKMYICRDRLGIKPLFYYSGSDYFIFSSEVKGILHSGLVEAVLDEESVDDYLGYRYVREPYTFFKNIKQVQSGHYICVEKDLSICSHEYWRLPEEFNMNTEYNEKVLRQEFKQKLEEAVLRRTISDVPLGTYLSGGVDSSILTAIVSRNSMKNVNTYTIGFPELNEFEYSDLVAEMYQTEHHKIVMNNENYFSNMQEIISYKDAPLGVPNEVPLAFMSKELKKKITVVLSGEGADELMGGYGKIYRTPFEFANDNKCDSFYQYFIKKYEYVPRTIRDNVLNVSVKRRTLYDEALGSLFSKKSNEYNVFHFFHKYHVKGLLQRVDATTMLAAVEARVPFLDHELIEYTYRNIPYELKLHWKTEILQEKAKSMSAKEFSEVYDVPKYLLREVAKEYIPVDIIERKKVGFPVPLKKWNESLISMVQKELQNVSWLKVSSEELIKQCREHENGSQLLWMFLNVQLFVKMYFSKEWRY